MVYLLYNDKIIYNFFMNILPFLNSSAPDFGGIVVVFILILLGPIIALVITLLIARWLLGMNEIIRLLEKIANKAEKE